MTELSTLLKLPSPAEIRRELDDTLKRADALRKLLLLAQEAASFRRKQQADRHGRPPAGR